MRGTFGRSRPDKTQAGVVISTYEGALYPPRPYRYYVVQAPLPSVSSPRRSGALAGRDGSPSPQTAPALILPSVDSDTVCCPRPRAAHPPPSLRTFFDCFVQPSAPAGSLARQQGEEPDAPLRALSEPLNGMHYPRLLPCWRATRPRSRIKADGSAPSTMACPSVPSAETVSAELTQLAKVAGLPAELYSLFTTAHIEYPARTPWIGQGDLGQGSSTPGTTASASVAAPALFVVRKPERLRVRPVPRHAPPRPVRRGTKVTLVSAEGQQDLVAAWQRTASTSMQATTHSTAAGRKRGRDEIPLSELFRIEGEVGEDDEDTTLHQRPKPTRTHTYHDDEDAHADGDDDDADDISVGLMDGDDDDLGGLDGSGGSGGDDDGDYF